MKWGRVRGSIIAQMREGASMRRIILCSCLIASCVLGRPKIASSGDETLGGKAVHALTRIEWALLWAQASFRHTDFRNDRFMVNYREGTDADTLEMVVTHALDVDRRTMNMIVESLRDQIEEFKTKKGWAWLKVKEVYLRLPAP